MKSILAICFARRQARYLLPSRSAQGELPATDANEATRLPSIWALLLSRAPCEVKNQYVAATLELVQTGDYVAGVS
jgi:hypothetical protein